MLALVNLIPKVKKMIFKKINSEKRDRCNNSPLKFFFALRKKGKTKIEAKRNLKKMRLNGGISFKAILAAEGAKPQKIAARKTDKTANP